MLERSTTLGSNGVHMVDAPKCVMHLTARTAPHQPAYKLKTPHRSSIFHSPGSTSNDESWSELAALVAMFTLNLSVFARRLLSRQFLLACQRSPPLALNAFPRPTAALTWNRRLSASSGVNKTVPLSPQTFPTGGFEVIDSSLKIEEEILSFYDARMFYPVRIGEVFRGRYQVITKFGRGAHSTIWLCRDLQYALFIVCSSYNVDWLPFLTNSSHCFP